ncbi:MAG: ABC transporter transmembrane domain-containing protein, partial [Chlamydiota bacterium]
MTLSTLGKKTQYDEATFLDPETDCFWLVEEGSVGIYIEEKIDNKRKPCKILLSFEKDQFFLPLKNEFHESIFFTKVSGFTTLRKIPFSELQEKFPSNPKLVTETTKYINAWIKRMYDEIIAIPNDAISFFLAPNKETLIPDSQKNHDVGGFFTHLTKENMLWVKVEQGSFGFLGESSIPIDSSSPPIPLSHKAWLKLQEESRVQTYFTEELLTKDTLVPALANFRLYLQSLYILSEKKGKEKEIQRSIEKKEIENRIIQDTFKKIYSIFQKRSLTHFFTPTHPLLQALRIIEQVTKIPWRIPSKFQQSENTLSMLQEICEYSYVRYRKIQLDKNFFTKDCGPLLSFLQKDQSVIVLLPQKNGYEAIDPLSQTREKVRADNVHKLSTEAYEFYPPFFHEKVSLRELFSIFLQGKGKTILQWGIFSIITIILSLYIPFANSVIFNRIIPILDKSLLYQVSLGLFVAAFSYGIFSFLSSFAGLQLQMRMNITLQTALWDRLLRLPVSFFRSISLGD